MDTTFRRVKNVKRNRIMMHSYLFLIATALLGGQVSAQDLPACGQVKIFASLPREFDNFGSSVDMTADYIVIGAPHFKTHNVASGRTYVFEFDMTLSEWVVTALLTAPIEVIDNHFGNAVAIDGPVQIVGSSADTIAGIETTGSAWIFRYNPAADDWIDEAYLYADDRMTNDGFGYAVDIEQNVALVGVPFDDNDSCSGGAFECSNVGAVYVYRFDPVTLEWVEEAKLTPSDGEQNLRFGHEVALAGNIAVISATGNSGAVYVFEYLSGSWTETARIISPDGASDDRFGWYLDYDGMKIAVGAHAYDSGGPDRGAVYLFHDNDPSGWNLETRFTPPPNPDGLNDLFGTSVDLDGDDISIGAFASSEGSAHVYRKTDGIWNYKRRMISHATLPGSTFSRRITLHDDTLVVGSAFDSQLGASEIGAAYVQSHIFRTDCNANCISDTEEIAADPALDCNLNGILDECDLTDGVTLDCNLNGIPDECEDCDNNGIADECDLNPRYSQGSGSLSPIGLGSDANFTFVTLPARLSDVTFDFTASAELGSPSDFIEVFLNSVKIGEVFNAAGTGCADPPDEDQIILPQSTFETIVGSGDADVLMTAFLDPFACGGANFVTVTMSFFTPLLIDIDTNDNGIIDSCDLARGDFNLDGVVNVTDLLSLLGAWGICPGCVEDTNGDGSVNVTDLLTLLANWG